MNEIIDTIKKYEREKIDSLSTESLREYCKALKEGMSYYSELQVQSYRKASILRRTIDVIVEKHEIDLGDLYVALAEGNNFALDDILYLLSK